MTVWHIEGENNKHILCSVFAIFLSSSLPSSVIPKKRTGGHRTQTSKQHQSKTKQNSTHVSTKRQHYQQLLLRNFPLHSQQGGNLPPSFPRSLALCAGITADPDRAGSQLAARSRGHLAAHHCATVISLRHTAAEGFSREEPEAQGPVPKAGALLEGGWKGGREDEVTAAGRAQTQCQAFSSSSSLLLYFPSPSPLAFLLAA